jgi:hypothetical protein
MSMLNSARMAGLAAIGAISVLCLSTPASAGPMYTFSTSTGTQPSDVGVITLTQINSTTVDVLVDLKDTTLPSPEYGFINTGGPHTPLTFTIAGTESGLSALFLQPTGGSFCPGNSTCPPKAFKLLSLNTNNESNTPFGAFGIGIDSSAGNGSGKAYYGDLEFQLTRTSGLSTDDFITNSTLSPGHDVYFAADLTSGPTGNTGAQGWSIRTTPVPEPASLAIFGTMLMAGAIGYGARRRRDGNPRA